MKASSKFHKTAKQRAAIDVISSHKYTLVSGGSRAGKTIILLYCIVVRALARKSRHAVLRFHFNDVKTSIGMDTLPFLLQLLEIPYDLNKTDWVFTLQNGSEIWLGGLDDKDRVEKILGKEYSTIYINEASQVSYLAYVSARTRLAETSGLQNKFLIDCNPPEKSHWLYSVFKLHEEPITKKPLLKRANYGYIDVNPIDNIENLPDGYIEETLSGMDARAVARFRDGVWLDKRAGALWDYDLVARCHVNQYPEFVRVVVGVDPAVTARESSDETGIVVVARGTDNHLYVLRDASIKGRVEEWAERVCNVYHDSNANIIVGEVNQGGDLVESVIRVYDPYISYKSVRAVASKQLRAEPIHGLYTRGLIHHTGFFPELEEQMTSWVPGDKSPDRLDALVWACTELIDAPACYQQPNESCIAAANPQKIDLQRKAAPPATRNGFGRARPPSFGGMRR